MIIKDMLRAGIQQSKNARLYSPIIPLLVPSASINPSSHGILTKYMHVMTSWLLARVSIRLRSHKLNTNYIMFQDCHFGKPSSILNSISTSTRRLLASTKKCTALTYCLKIAEGKEAYSKIQGPLLHPWNLSVSHTQFQPQGRLWVPWKFNRASALRRGPNCAMYHRSSTLPWAQPTIRWNKREKI